MTLTPSTECWVLNPDPEVDPFGDPSPIVLCTAHALRESNRALERAGIAPAETMNEVANILNLILHMKGDPDADNFLTYRERDVCQVCEGFAQERMSK